MEQKPETQAPRAQPGLCVDCPFWEHLNTFDNGNVGQRVHSGLCRRHSPRELDHTPERDSDGLPLALPSTFVSGIRPGLYPTTRGNDWCGDHPFRAALYRLETDDIARQMVKQAAANEKTKQREAELRKREAQRGQTMTGRR